MTNEQILKQAVEKAIINGWDKKLEDGAYVSRIDGFDYYLEQRRYYGIIFSHNFAKAFFGEEETEYQTKEMKEADVIGWQKEWRFHLQQMVLEDPILYLKKFL